jgi:hypothetical protein
MARIPLPSSAITNVIAGVEAAQTAGSLTLAIQGQVPAAVLMICSAVFCLASALLFGFGAGMLASAEQTVAARSWNSGYTATEQRIFRDEVRATDAKHAGIYLCIAFVLAILGVVFLMWGTAANTGGGL